jgi:Ca2+:H+ antiporter
MAGVPTDRIPLHVTILPALGIAAWLVVGKVGLEFLALVLAAVLLGNVIAAVHHAEVVALRVGEPYGTLVLALAVTVIEVSGVGRSGFQSIIISTGSYPTGHG